MAPGVALSPTRHAGLAALREALLPPKRQDKLPRSPPRAWHSFGRAVLAATHACRQAVSPRKDAKAGATGRLGVGQCLLLACALLSWAFCGAANEPIGLFIPQLKGEFASLAPQRIALVSSGYTFGTALSTLFAGSLADSMGRRAVCRLAAAAGVVAASLVALAPGFWALVAARALLGLCAGTFVVVMPALVVEGLPAENLDAFMAGYPVGWPLGALLCASLTGACSWRWAMSGAQLACLLPIMGLLCWLPESPKFLLGKGRAREAARAQQRLSGSGGPPPPPSGAKQHGDLEGASPLEHSEQVSPAAATALFRCLAVAFFLCGAASQAVKVWLPVWLEGGTDSHGSLGSFTSMYTIESFGILATAACVALRSASAAGTGGGGEVGGSLLAVARLNLTWAAAAALACLLCRGGPLAGLGGTLGGIHLVAQANGSTLMRACGARSLPVRGRAKKLSVLSLLYLSGCCLGPVLLGAPVTPSGDTFAGVQWVLVGATAVYVAAAMFRPVL